MLERLRNHKPCIKLLNKADLADPAITIEWQAYLETTRGIKTLQTSTHNPEDIRQIPALVNKLLPDKHKKNRLIQAMITGIPNAGKSTLINRLAGKAITRTGNEPAITKAQQRIKIGDNIMLHDTPGLLWPKIENPHSGYRLAVTGAIKDTATDNEELALFAADYLLMAYPDTLKQRYQFNELPVDADELLEQIGRRRGCLRAGGRIEYDKVAKLFLTEIRSGKLGAISFETPRMIQNELKLLTESNQPEQPDNPVSQR
jgi:ribosome biogenesis GTPase A